MYDYTVYHGEHVRLHDDPQDLNNYRRHVNNDFHYAVYDYFPRRPVNVYLHDDP